MAGSGENTDGVDTSTGCKVAPDKVVMDACR